MLQLGGDHPRGQPGEAHHLRQREDRAGVQGGETQRAAYGLGEGLVGQPQRRSDVFVGRQLGQPDRMVGQRPVVAARSDRGAGQAQVERQPTTAVGDLGGGGGLGPDALGTHVVGQQLDGSLRRELAQHERFTGGGRELGEPTPAGDDHPPAFADRQQRQDLGGTVGVVEQQHQRPVADDLAQLLGAGEGAQPVDPPPLDPEAEQQPGEQCRRRQRLEIGVIAAQVDAERERSRPEPAPPPVGDVQRQLGLACAREAGDDRDGAGGPALEPGELPVPSDQPRAGQHQVGRRHALLHAVLDLAAGGASIGLHPRVPSTLLDTEHLEQVDEQLGVQPLATGAEAVIDGDLAGLSGPAPLRAQVADGLGQRGVRRVAGPAPELQQRPGQIVERRDRTRLGRGLDAHVGKA